MNFSPSSISHPHLSRDGLRIRPAAEILHHLLLADHRDKERLYIEIKGTAPVLPAEIRELQDLPLTRMPMGLSHPALLRPT